MSDFTTVFADWLTQSVFVEPYKGAGAEGAVFDPPQLAAGVMIDDTRRLIRAAEGNETVSETTLQVPSELKDRFGLHDRVTLPDGRQTTVLRVSSPEVYGIFDFVVVNLA